MNWRLKALLQGGFSLAPRGEHLNYFMQRYVTRSLPVSDGEFAVKVAHVKRHIEAIRRYYPHPLGRTVFYEFGAGWDIAIALGFYGFGVEHQILVDIRTLVKEILVNDVIVKFRRMSSELCVPRPPSAELDCESEMLLTELKREFGIEYRAPCDPRQTGLPNQSVDCITSTSTLEHVPEADIRQIVRECYRILRDDGIMSMLIDYDDHYSYFDRKISPYNNLRYSDRVWALLNPALQYQNRLRHRDYLKLFQSAGFYVIEDQHKDVTEKDLRALEQIPLSKRFRSYSPAELAVHNAFIVLRKAPEKHTQS